MIEKILFRSFRIEVWAIILILILFALTSFAYGAFIYYKMDGGKGAGGLWRVVREGARLPETARRIATGEIDRHMVPGGRYAEGPGFTFYGDGVASPGYILLNHYNGDAKENIVELYAEGETEPRHVWTFDDLEALRFDVVKPAVHDEISSDASKRRAKHVIVEEDGEMVFHFRSSPMYKYDACQNIIWRNEDFAYHHALERDAEGNYWTPGSWIGETRFENVDNAFIDEFMVQVSPDGETLYSKSIIDMLEEAGLGNLIYTYNEYVHDPIHLNDVQPVLEDGPFWQRGDILLSIPHLNMIALFRPSTDALVWRTQDRMRYQHDVDVLDENRIAYFDNRRKEGVDGPYILGHNSVNIHDLRDGSTIAPWDDAMEAAEVRTVSQGLFTLLDDGSLFVEETAEGRLLRFGPDGEPDWVFVNKNSSGANFTMNWSRYLYKPEGDRILQALQSADCTEAAS